MKKSLLIIVLSLSIWGINLSSAQEEIPDVVYLTVEHLNQYLFVPINLTDQDVEWDWEIVTLDDFGDNCREREGTSAHLPDVAYDIHFYRLAESYHYRVSMDEQLIVPCIDPIDVAENTPPALIDALADLNRRFHVGLALNDLPWRWEETQFDDYTLDCPSLIPPEDDFDRSIDGYIIEFTLMGQSWTYHVSSDRLIVILCNK